MPAVNVIELRALLSEKFPGLRMRLDEPRAAEYKFLPSGLPQIDGPLRGGFPKGALSEIIVSGPSSGSATLMRALLEEAARANGMVALIDGSDSFNATQVDEPALARLLWVRCQGADEAVRAGDLILRDSNLPLVLLDLALCPESQLRKIPAVTWYRYQRLVEENGAACLVFTPRQMLAPARARIIMHPQFSIDALERDEAELLRGLKMDVSNPREHAQLEPPKINS